MGDIQTRKPVFREEVYESLFQNDGFVKVPLLTPAQADGLAAFYAQTKTRHDSVSHLHHTTTDTGNADLILEVDGTIKAMLAPALQSFLVDFKPLAATFHVKEPGTGSATGVHQDPTFVDEESYYSANVWVALQDIDETNGNLFFVKGSHRVVTSLRITPSCPTYYDSFRHELPAMAVQVPLKKGEAVIFHNATIHGATENSSADIRLASTVLVSPAAAQWLLYYREAEDKPIGRYHMDMDAFVALAQNGRPGASVFSGWVEAVFPQLSKGEFLARTGGVSVTKRNYLQKLRHIFSAKSA